MNAIDHSAQIARWIMQGDSGPDPRDLVFGIFRCFPNAGGEEIKRGILIALELHEAEMMLGRTGSDQAWPARGDA